MSSYHFSFFVDSLSPPLVGVIYEFMRKYTSRMRRLLVIRIVFQVIKISIKSEDCTEVKSSCSWKWWTFTTFFFRPFFALLKEEMESIEFPPEKKMKKRTSRFVENFMLPDSLVRTNEWLFKRHLTIALGCKIPKTKLNKNRLL